MKIRLVTARDVDALAAFATHAFSENFGHLYRPEDLAEHLSNTCSPDYFSHSLNHGDVLLLAEDSALAGYAKVGKLALPAENPAAGAMEIHRLYVDAPYQGKGVGKLLMEEALKILAEAPEIYLGVWENNVRAQAMYRRFGFEVVGEYLYHVGQAADRELIMCRRNHSVRN